MKISKLKSAVSKDRKCKRIYIQNLGLFKTLFVGNISMWGHRRRHYPFLTKYINTVLEASMHWRGVEYIPENISLILSIRKLYFGHVYVDWFYNPVM